MKLNSLKKSFTSKLLIVALPLLLLFGLLSAPSAQARDDRRGRARHEYRHGRGYGRGGYGYNRRGYYGGRRHGYWRRYHGRRYWYNGGRYYDGPGGVIITF